jgi:hypothetical protein
MVGGHLKNLAKLAFEAVRRLRHSYVGFEFGRIASPGQQVVKHHRQDSFPTVAHDDKRYVDASFKYQGQVQT